MEAARDGGAGLRRGAARGGARGHRGVLRGAAHDRAADARTATEIEAADRRAGRGRRHRHRRRARGGARSCVDGREDERAARGDRAAVGRQDHDRPRPDRGGARRPAGSTSRSTPSRSARAAPSSRRPDGAPAPGAARPRDDARDRRALRRPLLRGRRRRRAGEPLRATWAARVATRRRSARSRRPSRPAARCCCWRSALGLAERRGCPERLKPPSGGFGSSGGGTRTHNRDLNRVPLRQLSYPGMPIWCTSYPYGYRSLAIPASTSAWQLEQSRTHLAASARICSIDRVKPCLEMPNSFSAGSTWWK